MALIHDCPDRPRAGGGHTASRPALGRLPLAASAFLLAAFALGAATPAQAQEPHRRQGVWFSLGLGGGWNLTKNIDDKAAAGFGGYIRAGGTLGPQLLVGGEAEWWGREETSDIFLSRGNVTLTGLYFPKLDMGFFAKLGVGVAGAELITAGGSQSTWETGLGVTFGVGWDIPLGRTVSITPNADFLFQELFGTSNTLLIFTLGVTFP
jgi:hypothetical protein